MGEQLAGCEILPGTLPPQRTAADMIQLRLILGDQLNPRHSWFEGVHDEVVYVMMEIRQETDYVLHHAQKIIGIFAAMRDFAEKLVSAGHRVYYLKILDPDNLQQLGKNLDRLILHYKAVKLEYQAPDEWRLDLQLVDYAKQQSIKVRMVESEHFYTHRLEAAEIFQGRSRWLMEHFYRGMRVKHAVLMDGHQHPCGGRWNFDAENRKRWPGQPETPSDHRPKYDHSPIWQDINQAGVSSFGNPHAENFRWPLHRADALRQLDAFVKHNLSYFGDYQDAMHSQEWRLFHSLLSFALNTKMLNPREVVGKVAAEFHAGAIPIAAAEGFIRQILGWREYVRGVYWAKMPTYVEHSFFQQYKPLPNWFWHGKTRMRCLAQSIQQSLEQAYAHHIQRLMIIGNFALLAGIDPKALHHWYLGVYIDAFEWVDLPNTFGMSQYADGGFLASKPYVSTSAYIDRMSDYCKGCYYQKKLRYGENACPFNVLYWNFFIRNTSALKYNPRLSMVFRQISNMPTQEIVMLQEKADEIKQRVEQL